MAKDEDEYIRMRGTVLKMLPDSTFEVQLEGGLELLAKPSGRMRRGRGIRVLPVDTVDVEVSTYDPTEVASSGVTARSSPSSTTGRSLYGICQGASGMIPPWSWL